MLNYNDTIRYERDWSAISITFYCTHIHTHTLDVIFSLFPLRLSSALIFNRWQHTFSSQPSCMYVIISGLRFVSFDANSSILYIYSQFALYELRWTWTISSYSIEPRDHHVETPTNTVYNIRERNEISGYNALMPHIRYRIQ